MEHVHVPAPGDAVDLAAAASVAVVDQVDELVALICHGDVHDRPLMVPCLGVGETARAADRHGGAVAGCGVRREHDLDHRLIVVVPQLGEVEPPAGFPGERVHEEDTRPDGVDGDPAVARADEFAAHGDLGEVERAARREERCRYELDDLLAVTGSVETGNGEEQTGRRREGGAPRRADAADAGVGIYNGRPKPSLVMKRRRSGGRVAQGPDDAMAAAGGQQTDQFCIYSWETRELLQSNVEYSVFHMRVSY